MDEFALWLWRMRQVFGRRDANEAEKKNTNLWRLCYDGKLDEVRSALARGEDVNDKDSYGSTPLICTVYMRHNSIVKLLLDQPGVKINEKNNLGHTALLCAADENNPKVARMLLLHPTMDS